MMAGVGANEVGMDTMQERRADFLETHYTPAEEEES
jgi:hypothetical protein